MWALDWTVLALMAVPSTLALVARSRPLLLGTAALACAIPTAMPPGLLRGGAALITWVLLLKAWQLSSGEERPRTFVDRLLFFTTAAVVRWDVPRAPRPERALRSGLMGLGQLVLAALLVVFVVGLDLRNPAEIITTELGLYFTLAGVMNLHVIPLALRGLDYRDPFDNPLAARTPSEFWSRRWNTWVNDVLHRYVFVPIGGRRRPARGIMAAFAASAVLHEAIVTAGTGFHGGMLCFFLLQGAIVALTSRSRAARRFAARRPRLSWLLTLVTMATTGALLVWGMEALDPSRAWRRCCTAAPNRLGSRPHEAPPRRGHGTRTEPAPRTLGAREEHGTDRAYVRATSLRGGGNDSRWVMERGTDFLKSQVNNAVMQHATFLSSLEQHVEQAEDARFRTLCEKHRPRMQEHQKMLEEYQRSIGGESGSAKKVLGKIMGAAKNAVDSARESDFLRLVEDIVMSRQSEDTFRTFREAGRRMGNAQLEALGEKGEKDHDSYVAEANLLVQDFFVEHAQAQAVGAGSR